MKIGIDFHTVNDFMQGSRTYVYNLTRALIETDNSNEYYLYCTNKNFEIPPELKKPNVHIKYIVPASRCIRLPVSFPIALAYNKIDVFHCQYIGPPFSLTPYVVTIHDIVHETNPELFPKVLRRAMSLTYPFCAKRAAKVLTVSEYSKKEIARLYNIPNDDILVTYNAVSNDFRPIFDRALLEMVKNRYGIDTRYILFVGRLEPRKNIPNLVKAFNYLKITHGIPQKLVIAGMKDFKYLDIFETVKELQLEDEIIFTGRIEQEDLPAFYSGADLFVYPSLGEGFGIPPLEAMACGTPVVTSNTTSLPEVVGDAGIMIDPQSIEELSTAMLKVVSDSNLSNELKSAGVEQAKKFSWHKSAEIVLKCYEQIYEKRKLAR